LGGRKGIPLPGGGFWLFDMEETFMLPLLIVLILLTYNPAFSGEGLIPSAQELALAIQEATKTHRRAERLLGQSNLQNIFGDLSVNNGCSQQVLNQRKSQNCQIKLLDPSKGKNQTLVFVSFFMPEASLKSLFQEAPLYNAILVLRGLYQDSFVKTAQKLQELGITVDINPELFEKHHIASVPTFVFLKDGHSIFSLKGNVTLSFVAQKFKDQLIEHQYNSSKPKGALCS
jgi:conjugal transfer pilus assembly protein TrbC